MVGLSTWQNRMPMFKQVESQVRFGRQAMQMLTESGYIPEELFSQKGSTAEDAKFNKTLMADLSRQARQQ